MRHFVVNLVLIGYGLSRTTQIDYQDGLRNSNGIFAPTIRHYNGKFYIGMYATSYDRKSEQTAKFDWFLYEGN